jgi:hypothetical protein
MKTSQSISKISLAVLAAQKEMGNALKDSKNPFFKSSYADLNSVREAVIPSLNKHGISVLQLLQGDSLVTTLLHETGEFIISETNIVCKVEHDPQAYGSAITYARRYALAAFLCIGAEDDDGNAATRPIVQSKPQIVPTTKVTSTTASVAKPVDKVEVDPAEYVIQIGQKLKGKKLFEVDIAELLNFSKWLQDSSVEQNKSLSPGAVEYIGAVKKYKANLEVLRTK